MSDDESLVSYENVIHAVSGTIGGAFSFSLLFPFDTARTRLQVDDQRRCKFAVIVIRDLVYEEGWRTLYRGWQSLFVSLSVTNFVYFYVFYGLRSFDWSSSFVSQSFMKTETHSQSIFSDLLIGAIAGSVAVFVSNPFWVINTRLKLQGVKLGTSNGRATKDSEYNGITDCFMKIIRAEGAIGLWSGLISSLILVSNPAINFMIYEGLKRNILPVLRNFVNESSLYFCFGGTSKLVATIATYPMQMAQTRARAGVSNRSTKTTQWQNLRFWFRGLESKLVQTVLTSALMLLTYERIRSLAIFSLQLYLK